MEPLYWSPASPVFECTMDDARTLPQRVVWFGSTTGCPREVLKFIKPEVRSRDFVLLANFEIAPELKALLQRVVAEVSAAPPTQAPCP